MIFSPNLLAVLKKKNPLINNKPYAQTINIDRNAQRFGNRGNIYFKKSTNRGTKKNKFRFNNLTCMSFRNSTQHF